MPAVGEVVLVQETLTDAEAKVGQAYVSGIVTEANPAVMPDAILAAVDDEAVQVLIAPAQCSLKGCVEIGDRTVAANEQAAPDRRADTAQDDAQLVHHRLGVRERLRHCAIMAPAAISLVVPPLVMLTLAARQRRRCLAVPGRLCQRRYASGQRSQGQRCAP